MGSVFYPVFTRCSSRLIRLFFWQTVRLSIHFHRPEPLSLHLPLHLPFPTSHSVLQPSCSSVCPSTSLLLASSRQSTARRATVLLWSPLFRLRGRTPFNESVPNLGTQSYNHWRVVFWSVFLDYIRSFVRLSVGQLSSRTRLATVLFFFAFARVRRCSEFCGRVGMVPGQFCFRASAFVTSSDLPGSKGHGNGGA